MSGLTGAGLFALQTVVMPILSGILMAHLTGVPRADRTAFILYGLGLWSAMTALAVDLTLRFLPGLPRQVYLAAYCIATAAVACGALWVLLHREKGPKSGDGLLHGLLAQWKALNTYAQVSAGIAAVICAFFLLQNLSEPLTGNDAIVHTLVARIIARDMSAAAYPLATADPISGFLLEGVHPLGFPASKAIFMILLGDLDTPWHKPLTAIYFIYLLLAVGTLGKRLFGPAAGAFSAFIVASTPLMLHSVATAHIDPLRVHGFFLCLALLTEFVQRGERHWLPLGALALIEALHSHAGNIMLLGFLGPLFLVTAPGAIWKRLLTGFALCLPAIVLVSPQFIVNWRTYGSLLGVDYALERLYPAPFLGWTAIQRSLVTLPDIVWNGALAPLNDLGWFAASFWLGLAGIVLAIAQRDYRHKPVQVLLGTIAIYAAIMCLAVTIRYKSFYMNTRYMLVMAPVLALFGGHLFGRLLNVGTGVAHDRASAPRIAFSACWLLIVPAFISFYQVLLPYAYETVSLLGPGSFTDQTARLKSIRIVFGGLLSLLALLSWIATSVRVAAWLHESEPVTTLNRSLRSKASPQNAERHQIWLYIKDFLGILPIVLLLMPVFIRLYGGIGALTVRVLVNANADGSRSAAILFLLGATALLTIWLWRFPRVLHRLRQPAFYSLLAATWLCTLGYILSLDQILAKSFPALESRRFVLVANAVAVGLVTIILWLAARSLRAPRSAALVSVQTRSRRMLDYLLRRQPTYRGYLTISFLFVPALLANLYYGLGSLRSLIHPLYMHPSLIILSDIVKAEATHNATGGMEYLEPSLFLRNQADAGETPKTLTFRDAEIFAYGGGEIVSSYDPRVWDLYKTKTGDDARSLLLRNGFNHIYMPNYSSPSNNANGMGELLTRPDLLRITRQSEGSAFTLFAINPDTHPVVADLVYRSDLGVPLALERNKFSIFPKRLEACTSLRDVYGGVFGWYWAQIESRLARTSCLDAYANQNWISLPPAKADEIYRLEADLSTIGCAGLRIMHRLPPEQPSGGYSVTTSDFMHIALKQGETAVLWFQRPAGSDAIAIGLYGGCSQPSTVSAFRVERLREAPQ